MGNFLRTQNSFSFGEISSEFYASHNSNGVSELENMDVLESGALRRRPGLNKIRNVSNGSIIVPFPITESEKYLLVICNFSIDVYCNDEKITSVISPWMTSDLSKLQYAQRFNKIFFTHPDFAPRILTKTGNTFTLSTFEFSVDENDNINMPFMQFDDAQGITITMANSDLGNNYATFTTSADFWNQNSIGERLLVNGKSWVINAVQDARVAVAFASGSHTVPQTPITDWYEGAFSNKRGWPACVSFHQNRLIFACTNSVPNSVWMSKVGDYYNFNAGTGLDDEAISVSLLSAQHHQICTVVSSDKLQILTSVGEWAISSSPLTPSNVNIKQHTSVGSISTRYLPPQQIESSTVFISASGKDIRELDLDVIGENYNANDLCSYSKHLMGTPISMAYNHNSHQLFIVMDDGCMRVLNKYINTDISAWGTYTTDGLFKYVGVMGDTTYVIVKRGSTSALEKFDNTRLNDANTYNFSYKISAFPFIANGHSPKKMRARKISVRVINTKTLFVNGYRIEIPNEVFAENSSGYTGDLSINVLGTQIDTLKPLWTISSSEQLPATVLSVTIDGTYVL